jgi:hypothetical protein
MGMTHSKRLAILHERFRRKLAQAHCERFSYPECQSLIDFHGKLLTDYTVDLGIREMIEKQD